MSHSNMHAKTIAFIKQTHASLASAPSLEPGKNVNRIFNDLVTLCTMQYTHQDATVILRDPAVQEILPSLRALCAEGEFLLEAYWAKRLVKTPRLEDFPNYRNYALLVQLEAHCLMGVNATMDKMVFIGSGPLPLTSLLFGPYIRHSITNLDRSPDAICISKALSKALGQDDKVRFHHGEALAYKNYGDADIVVLAALVGDNAKVKQTLINHIARAMNQRAILMVRSTHRLRTLLYAPVQDAIAIEGFEPLIEVHPNNEVVNSVIVFQKK